MKGYKFIYFLLCRTANSKPEHSTSVRILVFDAKSANKSMCFMTLNCCDTWYPFRIIMLGALEKFPKNPELLRGFQPPPLVLPQRGYLLNWYYVLLVHE
jgi:hypothetical protein